MLRKGKRNFETETTQKDFINNGGGGGGGEGVKETCLATNGHEPFASPIREGGGNIPSSHTIHVINSGIATPR